LNNCFDSARFVGHWYEAWDYSCDVMALETGRPEPTEVATLAHNNVQESCTIDAE